MLSTVESRAQPSQVVVVMGVSGSGKTTVGKLLARSLGWTFADADDDHPAENVAKMGRGEPLDEEDRAPWLRILRARVAGWLEGGESAVLACSALTRASRDVLRVDAERMWFVHLVGSLETLRERIEQRSGHYMPAALLESQCGTLEPPDEDERAIEVGIEMPPEELVTQIRARLALPAAREA